MARREWPVVGRAVERQRLVELLSDSHRPGVVVAGPAGVGKTRLALTCLDDVERSGFAVARVTATRAASQLPFGALAPLLPEMQLESKRADDRSELLRRSASALVERASGRRLIVFVDDAHLLDDTSAILIHQLVSTQAAGVLVTLRTGEAAPDPVVGLWKDGLLERLELKGLPTEAIDEVLCSVLGGPVDHAAVSRLSAACQGNVLFLRELVQGALEDESLRNEGGIWRLVRNLSPSARLIELVEARLAVLEEPERAVLELVSFGEPLGSAELHALADPIVAERLERRGLLSTHREGRRLRVRLNHPIYGDVLRARIPGLRAQATARSLAEVVEAMGARRREDVLRVATWRLDGGGAQPELMLAAATMARWHYDFRLAERLARAALEAGAGFDAALLAAQLALLQGRGEEAEVELTALAAEASTDDQRGIVAITRLNNSLFSQGRIEEGMRIANEAEASIRGPAWRSEILARRSSILLATQGPRAAADMAEPMLTRTTGPALVHACLVASHSFIRLGRLDAALKAVTQGHAAELALPHPLDWWYPWFHIRFRCDATILAGRIEEAETLAYAHYEQGVADRSLEGQAFFAWTLTMTALARGLVRTAIRYGREGVALSRQLGRPQIEAVCLPYLAHALALSGRPNEAAEILVAFDNLGLRRNLFMGIDPLEAGAWTAVAGGDLRQGRKLLEEAAASADAIGDKVGAASVLHGLARLGRARAVVARLTEVAAKVEGDLTQVRLSHTRALAGRDAGGLDRASAAFESMGAYLLAAEAAADAAVAWRQSDHRRNAAAGERRAGRLIGQCEGATTPALQNVEGRVRLTPAERDVVVLAANGGSNKEIAENLHLSVRTVETYLQRAYDKLGVSGRDQLAPTVLTLDPSTNWPALDRKVSGQSSTREVHPGHRSEHQGAVTLKHQSKGPRR